MNPTEITCSACNHAYPAPATGGWALCPQCGHMQEIPTAPSTPTLSGIENVAPASDPPIQPVKSLGRISLKKLARNQARIAPIVEQMQSTAQSEVAEDEDDLFREDDLDREPLVGAYGSESTIINTDPESVVLESLTMGGETPDATAVHGEPAPGDVDALFDEDDEWEDGPTEAFPGVSLIETDPPPPPSPPTASEPSRANLPEQLYHPHQVTRRKTSEVGDLPARPSAGPRWGSRSPSPPHDTLESRSFGQAPNVVAAASAAPTDLPDLPPRPRSVSGAFAAASASPSALGRDTDLPGRPSGRPVDMGFFDQAAPKEALQQIGSVRLDRRTDEVPMEMELSDIPSNPEEQLIEDVEDDAAFDAVATDPSEGLPLSSPAAPDAVTPSMAGDDPLPTTSGLGGTSSAEMALGASGPGPMIPGFGGPVVPSLTQQALSVPATASAPPVASSTLIPPPPPPSAQPTAGVMSKTTRPTGAPSALVTPPPPDLGGASSMGAMVMPPPVAARETPLPPPPPASSPGAALEPPPPPHLVDASGQAGATSDQRPANGALAAQTLDPLDSSAGHDALIPLESAGGLALPALEDLPPEPPKPAVASAPSIEQPDSFPPSPPHSVPNRTATLQAAITSGLGDLSAELPPAPPKPAPGAVSTRLAPPQVSDDGIMVFVPDAPVAEGGIDEPGPAREDRTPPPSSAPPPPELFKDDPGGSHPLVKPQRRLAAGHGVAKKGEFVTQRRGHTLRLVLLIAIPTVLIVGGVVVAIVLVR